MSKSDLPEKTSFPNADDEEIVALFFARDESAITRTKEKYDKYLSAVAMNILKDPFEVEECLNDTYFRAWQSIPPERPTALPSFLAKIARNLSLDRYRAQSAEKRMGSRYAASLDELADSLADTDQISPEKLLDERETGEAISRFLREQRKLARQIFVCHYFYADSIRDIARRFQVSEAMVKTTLSRTRAKLREYLKKEGFLL